LLAGTDALATEAANLLEDLPGAAARRAST